MGLRRWLSSCRRPRLRSQHPHGGSQPSVALPPWDVMPSPTSHQTRAALDSNAGGLVHLVGTLQLVFCLENFLSFLATPLFPNVPILATHPESSSTME